MTAIHVRAAALDDTQSISALFRARVTAWQRMDAQGRVEDVPYEALSIYERWLHGGPWLSVETAALHLSHLLRGAGIALVALEGGVVRGYAEAFHGVEPPPFGDHLHVGTLLGETAALDDALLRALLDQARASRCERLTADVIANDGEAIARYGRHGMTALARVRRCAIPARSGQGLYKTVEHLSANPAQIAGWQMPLGRLGSARQQWETLWPRTFHAIAPIRDRRAHRLHLSASGQEALLYCQAALYLPRTAEISLWSPRPLTAQILTAIRDWAHREGYRALSFTISDEMAGLLGSEAEFDGYYQDVYGVSL